MTVSQVIGKKFINSMMKTSRFMGSSCFFSSHSFGNGNFYQVRLSPKPLTDSKIVMPISMVRYDGGKNEIAKYDKEIGALLKHTSEALARKNIESVDVVSSAGLQKINWGEKKAQEIEEHFLKVHHDLLAQHTSFYTWDEFIHKLGKEKFEINYNMIKNESVTGSEWYKLMVKVHNAIKLNNSLESSIEYQRREYAAIYTMRNQYTHIAYMGDISIAWAYLYSLYDNLPVFSKAVIEKNPEKIDVNTSEANTIIRLITNNVQDVLSSENFPNKEKQKLSDKLMSIIYAYSPKEIKTKTEESESQECSSKLSK